MVGNIYDVSKGIFPLFILKSIFFIHTNWKFILLQYCQLKNMLDNKFTKICFSKVNLYKPNLKILIGRTYDSCHQGSMASIYVCD